MSDGLPANLHSVLTSIGDHLQRIDGRLLGIESRLAAVEQGVTDLRVAVNSLKGRVDALPTTCRSSDLAAACWSACPRWRPLVFCGADDGGYRMSVEPM